jgi:transposase
MPAWSQFAPGGDTPVSVSQEVSVMIPKELEAKILRLHHAEKWKIGTMARELGVHHSTVQRVLTDSGVPEAARFERASMVEPFLPFIQKTLQKYPRLCSSRLFEMVKGRGYPGGPDHFRHVVALYRPRPPAEAYLRLQTLPGEQAQVDWGHFGKLSIGCAERLLMAFVMVLSYSRQIFLRFFLGAHMESFLRGHVAAFEAWQGVPRVLLYDNLKSAVLERRGEAIRFHPTLLDLAGHYRFEPRPVAVARGNEKGRVEAAIRYVRSSFFAARHFVDVADLNAQAAAWCNGLAADRRCPEDRTMTVRDAFAEERSQLLGLPDNPYPTEERREVKVGKTPYVRFDGNDYSVPHTHVRRTLVVLASLDDVRILDGTEVIACHKRSFSRREQIEDPAHIEALVKTKRKARQHRGMDRLRHAAPVSQKLMVALAERGGNLGSATAALLRLLASYGAAELEVAITEAIDRGSPHPHTVRLVLERRRHERNAPPPLPVKLPDDPRVRNLTVRPHELSGYDELSKIEEEDDD